jgi:signal transduction histidine kinase
MSAPGHNDSHVKDPGSPAVPTAAQFPLPGRQFKSFMLVFHVVFLGALAMMLTNRWHRANSVWSGRETVLVVCVLAQMGLYLRCMAFPRFWPTSRTGWITYLSAGLVFWFISWRLEPGFEWFVMAYLGQMFGVLPPRISIPFGLVVFAVYLPTKVGWERLGHIQVHEWAGYLAAAVGWSALGLFVHKLAATSAERATLIARLQAAQEELQRTRAKEAELAVLRERERLARDLHDSLGHGLVTLTVQLEAAQRLYAVDPAGASALVDEMKTLTRTSMDQLRRSLEGLRAPGLGERALPAAISGLCGEVSGRLGFVVDWQPPSMHKPLPPAVAEALWRTAQEALANVERHARAQTARVVLDLAPQEAVLRVWDDGIGVPEDAEERPGHYGLRGLRERVEGLGGAFSARRLTPAGTFIEARIPLMTA